MKAKQTLPNDIKSLLRRRREPGTIAGFMFSNPTFRETMFADLTTKAAAGDQFAALVLDHFKRQFDKGDRQFIGKARRLMFRRRQPRNTDDNGQNGEETTGMRVWGVVAMASSILVVALLIWATYWYGWWVSLVVTTFLLIVAAIVYKRSSNVELQRIWMLLTIVCGAIELIDLVFIAYNYGTGIAITATIAILLIGTVVLFKLGGGTNGRSGRNGRNGGNGGGQKSKLDKLDDKLSG